MAQALYNKSAKLLEGFKKVSQFIGVKIAAEKPNSLLRKFSIIFVGVALIPFIILFYLHSLYDESHRFIQILDAHFSLILVYYRSNLHTWFFRDAHDSQKNCFINGNCKKIGNR